MSSEPSTSLSSFATTSFAAEWGGLLYEISRQFASTLELDDVLSKVLSLTVQAVEANRGSIFLLNEDGRVTRSLLSRRHLPVEVKEHTLTEVMRDGLAGWVYAAKKADIIFDTESDDRWHVFPEDTAISRSAMAAPLMRRGKVIGIITMIHTDPHAFTPRHLMLLEVIATQAASAIENAAMYTKANLERLKLQAIIEGVQDIIFVTDLHANLILANPAAQTELGISPQNYGEPLHQVLSDPAILAFCGQPSEEQGLQEVTLQDERTFNASLARLPNVGDVVTMHDVTTFKRLDDLKDQFVSHVSHDLKAPLAIIQGYAWLLNNMPELSNETRAYASHILSSVDRMLGLIGNLLDLGRIEMGIESEFSHINLVDVVRNAAQNMDPLAKKKNLSFSLKALQENLPVYGSAVRIDQAAANLIGNAIKFTPIDGQVTVWMAQEGQNAVVRVQDSGPGIPAEMRSRLFEKFSRLGQADTLRQEGHGLGLAIVKSIIDAHSGKIWVESETGLGSMFAFSLPISSSPGQTNESELSCP
ncbi:MAG: ATP-binding protein [Chloroflexota bacterium]